MAKYVWKITTKEEAIKNCVLAEKNLLSAKGKEKLKIKRYIRHLKYHLNKMNIKMPKSSLQPKLKNFEKSVSVIHFDDLLTKRIIDYVMKDTSLLSKITDNIVKEETEKQLLELQEKSEKYLLDIKSKLQKVIEKNVDKPKDITQEEIKKAE